jgi:hypothetical protein
MQGAKMAVKQTVILDFDGVIHSYTSGWQGPAVCNDPPTDGAKQAVAALRELYRVVVCSSRCHQEGGIEAVRDYLRRHDIVVDDVSNDKPPHIVVVDDRALRFNGDWDYVLNNIEAAAVPWNKKDCQP